MLAAWQSTELRLPDRRQGHGSSDCVVGGDEWEAFNDCRGRNDAVRRIFWISSGKRHGTHANFAGDRKNHESGFNLREKSLQAGIQRDATFALSGGDFEQGDVRNSESVTNLTSLFNNCLCPLRDSSRLQG